MADSPITKERFAKGKTFNEYLESGIKNRNLFEDNYNGTKVSDEQTAKLKKLVETKKLDHLVVIGEDWCPDVYRGAGVAARIAEAAGIEMRFFERDQNNDMIQGYLKDGQFESIPVYVFYDKDHEELGHFIERPKLANEQLHETRTVLGDMTPAGIAARIGHEPSDEELAAERAKAREKYMEWQKTSATWAGWRTAAVDEVIELLS
jgi:hypothetical protein